MVMCTLVVFTIGALFATLLATKRRYRWLYILYKTLPRDVVAGSRFLKLNYFLWRWEKQQNTIPKVFTSLVNQHPEKTAFYFEDQNWTFEDVDKFSNKVARYFKQEGYQRGDTVALLLENRPEFVCIWLGLAKIGVVTALINANLVSDPLVHSVTVANSKALIFGQDFKKVIKAVDEKLKSLKFYQFNEPESQIELLENSKDLRKDLKDENSDALDEDVAAGKPRENLIYIYTSGTTGLPKAAVITNIRYMFMALGVHFMTNLQLDDVLYDPLPLYHSAGGMIGAGQTLLRGITVVVRRKFSASNFWKDCIKYNCTAAQYIGEICRYLMAVHENSNEKVEHKVRTMFGNGLRPQIWKKFTERFGIKEINEFYGATEGNSNLVNTDSTPGAVGFVPRYASAIYPVALIKCNEITGEPIRNSEGFCIRCPIGKPGVFIGKINHKKAANAFSGYADKKATQKKMLENVFRTGDLYFNSGDILVQDELGYYYFKDRTGDTFRWKGENVATSEVEAVISSVSELNDAVVYGVEIPGIEGKAGMAAIVDPTDSLDKDDLCKKMKENLPSYALPIFLRVMKSVPLTGTYKLKKVDLQKDGYDLNRIEDKLYFYNGKLQKYEPLTKEIYDNIISGKVKL